MWEGGVPPDLRDFDNISSHATTPNTLRSVAYTVKITRPQLAGEGAPTINMSVGSSWVATTTNIYVLGVGLNAAGDKIGAIIPATHLFSSGGLDYYEAEIPENANYLSKFCLADLSGSGNPLQLITLTVTSHIEPPAPGNPAPDPDSGMPGGGGGVAAPKIVVPTTTPTPTPTTALPDPENLPGYTRMPMQLSRRKPCSSQLMAGQRLPLAKVLLQRTTPENRLRNSPPGPSPG